MKVMDSVLNITAEKDILKLEDIGKEVSVTVEKVASIDSCTTEEGAKAPAVELQCTNMQKILRII